MLSFKGAVLIESDGLEGLNFGVRHTVLAVHHDTLALLYWMLFGLPRLANQFSIANRNAASQYFANRQS